MATCKVVACHNRKDAIQMTIARLGIPQGFTGFDDYSEYVNYVMDLADNDEFYMLDEHGERVGYVAWAVSVDIHRKGDIVDVHSMVAKRGYEFILWWKIHKAVQKSGAKWLSWPEHSPDGSIIHKFKEIHHG